MGQPDPPEAGDGDLLSRLPRRRPAIRSAARKADPGRRPSAPAGTDAQPATGSSPGGLEGLARAGGAGALGLAGAGLRLAARAAAGIRDATRR